MVRAARIFMSAGGATPALLVYWGVFLPLPSHPTRTHLLANGVQHLGELQKERADRCEAYDQAEGFLVHEAVPPFNRRRPRGLSLAGEA